MLQRCILLLSCRSVPPEASTNMEYITVLMENNPHVSRPVQFRGQLYLLPVLQCEK